MLTNLLLLLILVAFLLLLWTLLQKRAGETEEPTEEPFPQFPIPRPESDFVEPPRQEVKIRFDERGNVVRIEPPTLILDPNNQAAWSSTSGKIEIRFNPKDSPFGGASFI